MSGVLRSRDAEFRQEQAAAELIGEKEAADAIILNK